MIFSADLIQIIGYDCILESENTMTLPKGKAASIYHYGTYESVEYSYRKLFFSMWDEGCDRKYHSESAFYDVGFKRLFDLLNLVSFY